MLVRPCDGESALFQKAGQRPHGRSANGDQMYVAHRLGPRGYFGSAHFQPFPKVGSGVIGASSIDFFQSLQ